MYKSALYSPILLFYISLPSIKYLLSARTYLDPSMSFICLLLIAILKPYRFFFYRQCYGENLYTIYICACLWCFCKTILSSGMLSKRICTFGVPGSLTVEVLALSLLWLRFSPWPGHLCMPGAGQDKKEREEGRKRQRGKERGKERKGSRPWLLITIFHAPQLLWPRLDNNLSGRCGERFHRVNIGRLDKWLSVMNSASKNSWVCTQGISGSGISWLLGLFLIPWA